MTLSTYADLISGIRDWLARPNDTTTLPDTRLGDLVTFVESDIYARLRVRAMEASTSLSINAQQISLPDSYIETREIHIVDGDTYRRCEYRTPSQFWVEFAANTAGRPRCYTIEGEYLQFGPSPDATYTGRHLYYKRLPALSVGSNALWTAYPDIWLYGCLAHSAPLVGDDDRLPLWSQLYSAAMDRAQQQSDRDRYSGSPLVVRPG